MVEGWVAGISRDLKGDSRKELKKRGVSKEMKVPKTPFKVYDADKLKAKDGEDDWKRGGFRNQGTSVGDKHPEGILRFPEF